MILIFQKKNVSYLSDDNSIIFDKKLSLNDEDNIYNDIVFKRPNAFLP